MARVLDILARTPVLIAFLIAMLVIGYSFQAVQADLAGPLLDVLMNGASAQERLAEMTEPQKSRHLFATLINDTVYPIAYGGVLAGLAYRFGRERRGMLVLPALATVVVDLLENTVQALALSGGPNLLSLKTVLTPLKFGLFAISVLIILYLVAWAIGRRLQKKS